MDSNYYEQLGHLFNFGFDFQGTNYGGFDRLEAMIGGAAVLRDIPVEQYEDEAREMEMKTCSLCVEDFSLDPRTPRCRTHDFEVCQDCIKRHISTQINDRNVKIKCTSNLCPYIYGPLEVSSFLSQSLF